MQTGLAVAAPRSASASVQARCESASQRSLPRYRRRVYHYSQGHLWAVEDTIAVSRQQTLRAIHLQTHEIRSGRDAFVRNGYRGRRRRIGCRRTEQRIRRLCLKAVRERRRGRTAGRATRLRHLIQHKQHILRGGHWWLHGEHNETDERTGDVGYARGHCDLLNYRLQYKGGQLGRNAVVIVGRAAELS